MAEPNGMQYGVTASDPNDHYSHEVWWFDTLDEAIEWRSHWELDNPHFDIVLKLRLTKEMFAKFGYKDHG